jgi:hypothetical protein
MNARKRSDQTAGRSLANSLAPLNDPGGGVPDIGEIIDLRRYPIHDPTSPAGRSLLELCRRGIEEAGFCLLPGFLTSRSTQVMAEEACGLLAEAYFCSRSHNVYLAPDDPSFPPDHPRRRPLRTEVGSVACDRLPKDGPLWRLYGWDPMVTFVGAVLGKSSFYRLADPLGALSVNVFTEGGGHSWHFDESEFTTTIMLQTAERGGHFECTPRIRPVSGEDHEAVSSVLESRHEGVRRLEIEPGTLSIFGGRRSLHRVTRIEGERPRLVAVLCYSTAPGVVNSDLVRKLFWGRTA